MDKLNKILNKLFSFEKEPQKIGLTQLNKNKTIKEPSGPSLKNKNIKLSDLMRRAS